jgi:putative ABC transport system permease protein
MIGLDMLRESVKMSLDNIFSNRMRSFLTILGIVIGVTAIIALITIMQSASDQVNAQFEALGTGKVYVTITGTPLKAGLSRADVEWLAKADHVSGVAPSASMRKTVRAGAFWQEDVSIEGRSALYFKKNPDLTARGRAINPLDEANAETVCMIDPVLCEKLFFAQDPLGRSVSIGGLPYTVIGVLSDSTTADVMSQAQGGGDDGKLIIPYTSVTRHSGTQGITSLEVYISDPADTDIAISAMERALDAAFNYKDDSYQIINMQSLLDSMKVLQGLMMGLLAGIASIALLVGGIGIMNMMLVSVTERTMEIGLRKALGAEPGQIQLQFLIESFLLSLMGGLIGTVLGLAISMAFSASMDIPFSVSHTAIALGVGFSAAVGILFGWAPARKASNLNPIDALRSA